MTPAASEFCRLVREGWWWRQAMGRAPLSKAEGDAVFARFQQIRARMRLWKAGITVKHAPQEESNDEPFRR